VVLHCNTGCGVEEIAAAELGYAVTQLFHDDDQPAPKQPPATPPERLPSQAELAAMHGRLVSSPKLIARLTELRGWTKPTLERLYVGFDGRRIILPIRDEQGELVNVLRYLPGERREGERKLLAARGRGRELFPSPESFDTAEMWLVDLPSGRWRAQIHDPKVGHSVSVSRILGPEFKSFETKKEAKAARARAAEILGNRPSTVTVAEFAQRWTTDALFRRPKESTQIHNSERIKRFVERYGDLPLHRVNDQIVGEWLAGGKNASTVSALRAMFNDASSAKAGRLITANPFARLGIRKSTGNRHVEPPSRRRCGS
jgi:hypothetical protein